MPLTPKNTSFLDETFPCLILSVSSFSISVSKNTMQVYSYIPSSFKLICHSMTSQ